MRFLLLITFLVNTASGKLQINDNLDAPPKTEIAQCIGGGGANFTGSYYSFKHILVDYRRQNTNCEKSFNSSSNSEGKKLNTLKKELLNMIESILAREDCNDSHQLLKKFKKDKILLEKELLIEAKANLEKMERDVKRRDMQVNHPFLAYNSTLCTTSLVAKDDRIYFQLINNLSSLKYSAENVEVERNGEVISSCANVSAHGVNDLSGFYISLEKATSNKANFSWETYTIPDQIIITQNGSELYKTDCSSQYIYKNEITLKSINPSSKIKVEVIGKCKGDFNEATSAWNFHFSCDTSFENSSCSTNIEALIQKSKDILEQSRKVFNKYWDQVVCYEDLYTDVLSKHLHKTPSLHPIYLGRKIKKLNFQDPIIKKAVTKKLISDKKKIEEIEKSDFSIKQFKKNKKNNCPKEIDQEDSIFKLISKSYCDAGIEKLFED